jgi:hypothetical protein
VRPQLESLRSTVDVEFLGIDGRLPESSDLQMHLIVSASISQ